MGATIYPVTSERDYHYELRNIPDEGRSHLLCGGSLKSSLVIDIKWKQRHCYTARYCYIICLFLAQQPPVGQRLLIRQVSRSHTTPQHSRQDSSPRHRYLYLTTHTTLTTDKRPCPRWNLNLQSQQTYALNRAATGTGILLPYILQ